MRKAPWLLGLTLLLGCRLATAPATAPLTTTPMAGARAAVGVTATLTPTLATTAPPPTPEPFTVLETRALRSLPGVGRDPQALALAGGRLYVANRETGNVSVIVNDRVVSTIQTGKWPVALAVNPATGRVFVANQGDDSLSIIAGDEVVATMPGGKAPSALAVLGGRLFVGSYDAGRVEVFDADSGEQQATIALDSPVGVVSLAADPVGERIYAAVYGQTFVIDAATLAARPFAQLGSFVTLAVDPAAGRVYVNDYDTTVYRQFLTALDAEGAVVGRAPLGVDPQQAVVDPATGRVYVVNSTSDDVTVIDGATMRVVATTRVGQRPVGVALDTQSGRLYVANAESDNVAVLDTRTNDLALTIPLAIVPRAVAADPRTGQVYVASPTTNSLFVLMADGGLEEWTVGLQPVAVAVSPETGRVYVANHVSDDVAVIDGRGRRMVATVPVNPRPEAVAVDALHGRVYAGNTVIDAATGQVIGDLGLEGTVFESSPRARLLAVDAAGQRVYAVASNGIPGSNYGLILYVVDTAANRQLAAGLDDERSVTALVFEPGQRRLYYAFSRAIVGTHHLRVYDPASQTVLMEVPLPARCRALAVNPATQHLFVGDEEGNVSVYDTRTLGSVTTVSVGAAVGGLALVGDRLYVASAGDGALRVIADGPAPQPPAPTPTSTPTPYATNAP